jgi:hypothetical protein
MSIVGQQWHPRTPHSIRTADFLYDFNKNIYGVSRAVYRHKQNICSMLCGPLPLWRAFKEIIEKSTGGHVPGSAVGEAGEPSPAVVEIPKHSGWLGTAVHSDPVLVGIMSRISQRFPDKI